MSVASFPSFAEEFFQHGGMPSPREIAHLELEGGMELAFFPSVGPLSSSHCLIVPEEPVHSFAELDIDGLEASFEAMLELRRLMKLDLGENIILGEHGATGAGSRKVTTQQKACLAHQGGACTDHAHWHLSTTRGASYRVLDYYTAIGGRPERFRNIRDLKKLEGTPYFMLSLYPEAAHSLYIWRNPQEKFGEYTRQFFRRAVFAAISDANIRDMRAGRNEGWDWHKKGDLPEVTRISDMVRTEFARPNYYAEPVTEEPRAQARGKIVKFIVHNLRTR
ncbi:MAG: hypothetical protein EYC62_00005 [Alphaproteobacteria bacterium]|nr:MAG: hypothetical protein EYC62_00005 [Alphaproteobacteria bacterium]